MMEILPDIKVFLDIDDMTFGTGAEYLNKSNIILIVCTKGYFDSKNCMREMLRAVLMDKQIIMLMEPEVDHGAMLKPEVRQALKDAEESGSYERWGLLDEVAEWHQYENLPPMPSCDEIMEKLFAMPLIEWNRIGTHLEREPISILCHLRALLTRCLLLSLLALMG